MCNLTPADVRNVAFRKPPLGKRGYDEKEVDDFLDAVEQTIAALMGEIGSLRAQLGHRADPLPSSGVRRTFQDVVRRETGGRPSRFLGARSRYWRALHELDALRCRP